MDHLGDGYSRLRALVGKDTAEPSSQFRSSVLFGYDFGNADQRYTSWSLGDKADRDVTVHKDVAARPSAPFGFGWNTSSYGKDAPARNVISDKMSPTWAPFEWNFKDSEQQIKTPTFKDAPARDVIAEQVPPTWAPFEWNFKDSEQQIKTPNFKDGKDACVDYPVKEDRENHPFPLPLPLSYNIPWDEGKLTFEAAKHPSLPMSYNDHGKNNVQDVGLSPGVSLSTREFDKQENVRKWRRIKWKEPMVQESSPTISQSSQEAVTSVTSVSPDESTAPVIEDKAKSFVKIGRPILGRGLMLTSRDKNRDDLAGGETKQGAISQTKQAAISQTKQAAISRNAGGENKQAAISQTKQGAISQTKQAAISQTKQGAISRIANKQAGATARTKRSFKSPLINYANGSINCFVNGRGNEKTNGETDGLFKAPIKSKRNPTVNGKANEEMKPTANDKENRAMKRHSNGVATVTTQHNSKKEKGGVKAPLKHDLPTEGKAMSLASNESSPVYWSGIQTQQTFFFGQSSPTTNDQSNTPARSDVSAFQDKKPFKMGMNGNGQIKMPKAKYAEMECPSLTVAPVVTVPTVATSPQSDTQTQLYSTKVFVGGLPPDVVEADIVKSFEMFGVFSVDWPYKEQNKLPFPPKGFAFLMFKDESSVQVLMSNCKLATDGSYYAHVSSISASNKMVEVRPWLLSHAKFICNKEKKFNHRHTVFVGGISRTLKARELAYFMAENFGAVTFVGIDTDLQLNYPKGSSRVIFERQESVIRAISTRFTTMMDGHTPKRIELKPYVLDHQMCDECKGINCGGKFAPYFCANIACLMYFCTACWQIYHERVDRILHRPTTKQSTTDRPRAMNFK